MTYLIRSNPDYKNVEIIFGVYALQPEGSLTPGNYVATADVKPTEATVTNMQPTNQDVVLLPSSEGADNYADLNNQVTQLRNDVSGYFPTYTGLYAYGYFTNNELTELQIMIPIEFYAETEIVGFTQYLTTEIENIFSKSANISVQIYSPSGEEALMTRPPNGTMSVYYY